MSSTILPRKNVLVIGMGAVGALYAFLLKRSGLAHVTVVARSNYETLKRDGMTINSRPFGDHSGWQPDRMCRTVADAANAPTPYDYVFLATKCVPEILSTSNLLAPLLSAKYGGPVPAIPNQSPTTFVLLQNGLGIEEDLHKATHGGANIVNTAIYLFASANGNTIQVDDVERVQLGIYRPNDFTTVQNSSSESDVLSGLQGLLKAGGSNAEVVPEIQRVKFHKNMYNVVFAGVSVLTRYAMTAVFRLPPAKGESYEPYVYPKTQRLIEEHTVPLMEEMFAELIRLGHALGFPDAPDGLPSDAGRRAIAFNRASHATPHSFHKPSTLLDLERGVPMEVEVIWGTVVRLARERGVSMPRVEMAYALLGVIQNQILRERSSANQ